MGSAQDLRDAFVCCISLIDDRIKFDREAVSAFATLRRVCLHAAKRDPEAIDTLTEFAVPMYKFLLQFGERHHRVRIRQIVEVFKFLFTSDAWERAFESSSEVEAGLQKLPQKAQELMQSELTDGNPFASKMLVMGEEVPEAADNASTDDKYMKAILQAQAVEESSDTSVFTNEVPDSSAMPAPPTVTMPASAVQAPVANATEVSAVPLPAVACAWETNPDMVTAEMEDEREAWGRPKAQWIRKDGLPGNEGEDHVEAHTKGLNSVQSIRQHCESVSDCVGFAYCPAKGVWWPKKMNSGFFPNVGTCTQKNKGEFWEWHYISSRAKAKVTSSRITSADSGADVGAPQALYMWMWGDRNFLATFNPKRWSEWMTAEDLQKDIRTAFDQDAEKNSTRPIKIKDQGRGDWRFGSVVEALWAISDAVRNGGEL